MIALYVALAGVAGVLATQGVNWMVARLKNSGNVETSEAAKLWDEGTIMRLELRDEVASLKAQLSEAIAAITALQNEIRQSRAETEMSREETRLSRAETRKLMEQVEGVRHEVKTANELTLGQLADNTETRRILEVPKDERSPMENEHVATASDRIPEEHLPVIPEADQEMPSE